MLEDQGKTDRLGGAPEQARRLLKLSNRLDEAERVAKSKPIFALDSNVVVFLSHPSAEAKTATKEGVRRQGLGEIFESDPEELQELVAHALAEHLYVHLRQHAPLLVIPPATRELHKFANWLTTQTVTRNPVEMEKWSESGRKLLGRLEKLGTFNEQAPPLIHQVQEVLFLRYGSPGAARRLRHLLGRRLLVSSDIAAQSTNISLPEEVRRVLQPFRFVDSAYASQRAEEWLRMGLRTDLKTVNPKRKDAERRDAAVLVRLEQINQELFRTSDYRIVYVTADRHLLGVVGRANNPYLEMHHPRAWLTRLSIFERPKLEDFAGREAPSTSLADLLRLAAYESDQIGGITDAPDPLERWTEYLVTAAASFVPSEEARELFFDQPRDMLDRYSAELGRFHSDLVDLQIDAWENCFQVTAITAATEAQLSERDYARSVPSLVFEEWEQTDRIINRFLLWHAPEDFDLNYFRAGLEKIDEEDETGYARYVALATIFASRGEWSVAESLIKRAFERKSEGASLKGGPNGREASFMEAVCRRHLAKSAADLDEVESLLERAEKITRDEYGPLEQAAQRVVPERYQGERIANEISRFFFQRYASGVVHDDQDRLVQLAKDLERLFVDVRERLKAFPNDPESPQRVALRQLLQRTIVNILGLSLTATHQLPIFAQAYAEAEKLGLNQAEHNRELSAVTRMTLLAYRRIIRHENPARLRDDLSELLTDERHLVFRYDKWRFREILARASAR